MQLGNIALGIALADFQQRGEFFGAQRGPGFLDHLALQLPFCFEVGSLSDRLMSSTPE